MNRRKWLSDFTSTFKESAFRKFCGCGQQRQELSLRTKLCYAAGGVPYQMTAVAMGVSLQIFLLDVVQMEAFYVSMILFASRAWDAVTDPLVGFLVSRSRWTPIGKLSPWLALSAPFAVLSYLLLWFVPQASMSAAQTVSWFFAVTCLFETLMSSFNVPYLSLNMFLGGTKRGRDSATAYRMSVEMVALLTASIIQGHVVSVYNSEKQKTCDELDQVQEGARGTAPPSAPLQGTKRAFMTSAFVIGAIFFLCSLIIFLGVKEQKSPDGSQAKRRLPFLTSFKKLVCFVPYHRLVLAFTISTLAYQMSLGNFALFCSHAAGLGAYFQLFLLVLLGSATVAVPIWQVVLLKIGKKTTIFIGLTLFIPAVLLVACVPSNFTVFIVMCAVMGFSVATAFLLPWSMLSDVIDEFALLNPNCKDLEPLFFSCYAFCNKLAGGLAAGASTLTLQFVGYESAACSQSDEVVTALVILFSPVPIALLLLSMFAFLFYPLNERPSSHLQDQIFTLDSQRLSPSPEHKDCERETPSVDATAAGRASSDDARETKADCAPGNHSRPKRATHQALRLHSADGYEARSCTNANVTVKPKVSWV